MPGARNWPRRCPTPSSSPSRRNERLGSASGSPRHCPTRRRSLNPPCRPHPAPQPPPSRRRAMPRAVPSSRRRLTLSLVALAALAAAAAPVPQDPTKPVPGPHLDAPLTIDVQANALLYNPFTGHLYAAVAKTAPTGGNTVAAYNPATGALVWSVDVGDNPAVLALSDDGKVLWVGLRGAAGIQRIDVAKRKAGQLLPLGQGNFGPSYAE